MGYRDRLTPAQADFVAEIVQQIPEHMGGRAAFEMILNKLSAGSKYRFYVVDTDKDLVSGLNDEDQANTLAEDPSMYVISVQEDLHFNSDGEEKPIKELK